MSNFGISAERALIDRVYLNDLTIKAHQERAQLMIERDLAELERDNAQERLTNAERALIASDQTMKELEYFHIQHAKEIVNAAQ